MPVRHTLTGLSTTKLFAAAISAFFCLALVIAGATVLYGVGGIMTKQQKEMAETELALSHKYIRKFLRRGRRALANIASSPLVVNAVMGMDVHEAEIVDHFAQYQKLSEIKNLAILDLNLDTVYSEGDRPVIINEYMDQILFGQIPYDVSLLSSEDSHVISILSPVSYRNSIEGILVAEIELDLDSLFREILRNHDRRISLQSKKSIDNEYSQIDTSEWLSLFMQFDEARFDLLYSISLETLNKEKSKYLITTGSVLLVAFGGAFVLILIVANRLLLNPYKELQYSQEALELKSNALELSEREARKLALVAEHALDTIVITDADGQIIWVNSAFVELTGYQFEEVAGKKPGDILQGPGTDSDTVATIGEGIVRSQAVREEILNYRKTGEAYWIDLTIVPVRQPDGQVTNFVAVERDTTNERLIAEEREAARRQAEVANQAKSQFLANMSHEIRTPMNGVIGMTDLLLDTQMDNKQRNYAELIASSGKALLTLIDDILDLSSAEADKLTLKPETFNLRELIEEVAVIVSARTPGRPVRYLTPWLHRLPEQVVADPGRVRQMLINLAGNAAKFTESGHVAISVEGVAAPDQLDLVISIEDTGVGISEDQIASIFERFVQLEDSRTKRFAGTGLGLAITKQIVDAMDGKIKVRSVLGEGSCFSVSISLPRGPDIEPSLELEGLDIGLIERDERHNALITQALREAGAKVSQLGDVKDAQSAANPLDLVVADVGSIDEAISRSNDPPIILIGAHDERLISLPSSVPRCQLIKAILSIFRQDRPPVQQIEKPRCDPSQHRILLAEDSEINVKLIVAMLEPLGFDIQVASDGEAVVKEFARCQPSLVLMDIAMPKMSGLQATKAIREFERSNSMAPTPIVALSANAFDSDKRECLDAGMQDHLSKPIRKAELLEGVERHIC